MTEHEIELGVLMAEDTSKNCLWFKRVFDDIDDVKPNKELARYYGIVALQRILIMVFF